MNPRHALLPNDFFESAPGVRYVAAVRKLALHPEDVDPLLEAGALVSRGDAIEDATSVRECLDRCRRVESIGRSDLTDEMDENQQELAGLRRAQLEINRKITIAERTERELADRQSSLDYERRELSSALMNPFLCLTAGDEINAAFNV